MTRRHTSRSMIWRAEIAAALLTDGDAGATLVAESLGMVLEERRGERPEPFEIDFSRLPMSDEDLGKIVDRDTASSTESTFWQPFYYEQRAKPESAPVPEGRWGWRKPPQSPPAFIPIAPKRVVHPRLKVAVSSHSPGNALDWPQIVRAVARQKIFHRFPKKHLRRWGRNIVVVLDGSDRLIPFFEDQDQLCRQLTALVSEGAVTLVSTHGPDDDFVYVNRSGEYADWTFTTPSRVIVLSDLGVLRKGGSEQLQARWAQWGQKLAKQGCSLVGLVPFPVQAASRELRQTFTLVPWQQSAQHFVEDENHRAELVDQLLAAASPVVRLEPGLLRALRQAIPGAADASLEAALWQHPILTSRHLCAASLDRRALEEKAVPAFAKFPDDIKLKILKTIRDWRYEFRDSPEVWFQEVLNLDADSQKLLDPDDVQDAVDGFNNLATRASTKDETTLRLREYGGRAWHWFSDAAKQDPRIDHAILTLRDAAPFQTHREFAGLDPALIPEKGEPLTITLSQVGNQFQFSTDREPNDQYIAPLQSKNGWIEISPIPVDRTSFWKSGIPPAWAKDWDRDQYGAWVSFDVPVRTNADGDMKDVAILQPVTQRMRWIPSGRFLMGSPESEEGRDPDEGPQHEVTLTQGFWMFETPVTRGMWIAVTGEQLNRPDVNHPVVFISWNACQAFLSQINSLVAGLNLSLASESQWEYACRAGTQSAYSFGDNPALLGEYAWYAANSGKTTRPVATKLPNPWGLFDMHGNVREWCQDYWTTSYAKYGAINPVGPQKGRYRVLRGGGWNYDAHDLRSARRNPFDQQHGSNSCGFRCIQVQMGEEPADEGGNSVESAAPTTNRRTIKLRLDINSLSKIDSPTLPSVRILSDVAALDLRRVTNPNWTSAIGRDEYGLWSEFTFPASSSYPVVQRMRWIPPGRFLMGSSTGELTRFPDEGPQFPVTISNGYWIFETPVTQKLWRAVMNVNLSAFLGENRPVENVSWDSCQMFLKKLNGAVSGLNLSLPTEAQWEYACRAGSQSAYSFGDDVDKVDAYAWHRLDPNSRATTHEVARKLPNPWGLYDMHGNVWEWCEDYWLDHYEGTAVLNPTGPARGRDRVLRGGSWNDNAMLVRSACRYHYAPSFLDNRIGFRCVQVDKAVRGWEVS